MRKLIVLIIFFTSTLALQAKLKVQIHQPVFSDVPIQVTLIDSQFNQNTATVLINQQPYEVDFKDFKAQIPVTFTKNQNTVEITLNEQTLNKNLKVIPLWWSIIPPLLAILFALVFKEVVVSLLLGLFVGLAVMGFYQDGFLGIFLAFFTIIDTYLVETIANWGHTAILLFTLIIGAMVAVISKNGGMQGVVNILAKKANNSTSGQWVTWLLGIAIFFDDYANSLIVGNTMRPITDKLKISRQKLAYLVDSTAAPVASLAFITTWIGAELSYIQEGISTIPEISSQYSTYGIFFNSLQYSFYPIFTLAFMAILIYLKKDFGPMLKAEKMAKANVEITLETGTTPEELKSLEIKKGLKPKWWNAVIPILIVLFGTALGLYVTGSKNYIWNPEINFFTNLSEIIGRADSFYALLWSSFTALTVAISLSVFQKDLSLDEAVASAISGIKTMLPAAIILTLAWALAKLTENMHTAHFITSLMKGNVELWAIPVLTFLVSALVAFSTGSSWGTMAILYPLILPATWQIGITEGLQLESIFPIFANVTASVLAGSVLGDHCSPISDTTILSSLASSCNHIEHVKTQLPYALTVGLVAIFIGIIPASFGISSLILFPLGLIVMYFIVKKLGKSVL